MHACVGNNSISISEHAHMCARGCGVCLCELCALQAFLSGCVCYLGAYLSLGAPELVFPCQEPLLGCSAGGGEKRGREAKGHSQPWDQARLVSREQRDHLSVKTALPGSGQW